MPYTVSKKLGGSVWECIGEPNRNDVMQTWTSYFGGTKHVRGTAGVVTRSTLVRVGKFEERMGGSRYSSCHCISCRWHIENRQKTEHSTFISLGHIFIQSMQTHCGNIDSDFRENLNIGTIMEEHSVSQSIYKNESSTNIALHSTW